MSNRVNRTSRRVAVFGLGYVGTVTAACLSRDGHDVIGVDIDRAKTTAINAGRSPVVEQGLEELVSRGVSAGQLRAVSTASEAVACSDIAMIAVASPANDCGDVETSAIERVLSSIGECLRGSDREYLVVLRSTLLPEALEAVALPALSAAIGEPVGQRVRFGVNPEFLREATAIADYDHPPFIVAGADETETADEILDLYHRIPASRLATDLRTASLIKYASNSFHALKIAFANEIGQLSRALGADGRQVMDLMCRDTQLNISTAYLRPGFAFGGSCLPKDIRAMVRFGEREGLPLPLLGSVLPSNESMLARGVSLVQSRANGRRRIGLMGLSFKAGTDDLRESPFVRLAEALIGRGYDLRIFDPAVETSRLCGRNRSYVDDRLPHLAAQMVSDPTDVFDHADLLVLCTNVADSTNWKYLFNGETVDLRDDLVMADSALATV